MPVTSLRKACVRPPEVAKIKSQIKSQIRSRSKARSRAGARSRAYVAVAPASIDAPGATL
ncbi:hypothetical protein [Pseudomonas putida]|uniref:hypothetical protein n=1 Tax=Pseudomonas putida TaxID=303 RepID=UPI003839FDAC